MMCEMEKIDDSHRPGNMPRTTGIDEMWETPRRAHL